MNTSKEMIDLQINACFKGRTGDVYKSQIVEKDRAISDVYARAIGKFQF